MPLVLELEAFPAAHPMNIHERGGRDLLRLQDRLQSELGMRFAHLVTFTLGGDVGETYQRLQVLCMPGTQLASCRVGGNLF